MKCRRDIDMGSNFQQKEDFESNFVMSWFVFGSGPIIEYEKHAIYVCKKSNKKVNTWRLY